MTKSALSIGKLIIIVLSICLFGFSVRVKAQASEPWNEDRVGLFIHWGLYSATEGAWNGNTVGGASEWIQHGANIPTASYSTTLKPLFSPSATWATDIAQSAKAAGMKYVVITAKHHDGFTLFNSTEYWSTGATNDPAKTSNPYGGSNISPTGRDLMQELVTAVRAEGLKVGFYYSIIDWQHPNSYRGNNGLPKPAVMGNSKFDENSADPDPNAGSYKTYIFNHVKQLMTEYGEIHELWFDYSSTAVQDTDWDAAALMTMIRTHQPNLMVNNRLYEGLENSNGDFATPERTIPATGLAFDWETVTSWDDTSWGYKSNANGASYKTARQAIQLYAEASSKGGNMLLNIGPDRFGAIPTSQATRMTELGNWMAVNGEALNETQASGIDASGLWGRMTMHKSGNQYHAIVFNRPGNGVIDITSVTTNKIVNSLTVTRLTPTGPVVTPVTNNGGIYTVNLDSADLDAQQSATFRIDLDAITLPNLATEKSTSSSSVYDPTNLNLHAGLAVDGDYSAASNSSSLNMFHSDSTDTDPWFMVDLQDTFRIKRITIHNRKGFESRLRDITVEILDASDNVIATYANLNDGNVLGGPPSLEVDLPNNALIAGRKIRVTRASDSGGGDDNTILAISEIDVFGFALADVTLDGVVDQNDLDLIANNWGNGTTYQTGDLNGDGLVNQADLTLVLESWTGTTKANLVNVPAIFIDADNDKLNDNWEMAYFGNITSQDEMSNNDGDAYSNLWEIAFGGDPTVKENQLGELFIKSATTGVFEFRYPRPKNHAQIGITYRIESSTLLVGGSWTTMVNPTTKPSISIDAQKEWAVFHLPSLETREFYRVVIEPTAP